MDEFAVHLFVCEQHGVQFGGVTVGFCQFREVFVVAFVQYMLYDSVSSSMFVVFCFVIDSSCVLFGLSILFVFRSSFVAVVGEKGERVVVDQFGWVVQGSKLYFKSQLDFAIKVNASNE